MTTPFTGYQIALLQNSSHRIIKQRLSEVLRRFNLSVAEWEVLAYLSEYPDGLTSAELADVIGVEPPLTSRWVESLLKQGLVKRQPISQTKRGKNIVLTVKGQQFATESNAAVTQEVKKLLSEATMDETRHYSEVLTFIAQQVKG